VLRARTNIFLDKWLPALKQQSYVLGVLQHKHDVPTLIERTQLKRTQPNPVFNIQRLFTHQHMLLSSSSSCSGAGMDGYDPNQELSLYCAVLDEEGVELSKIRGVHLVFVWCGPFVVDGSGWIQDIS
jgi:hypothetical protein